MLKKFFEWLKSLFRGKNKTSPLGESNLYVPPPVGEFKESSTGVMFDTQKHKFINFIGAPVMYFPKAAADPCIGFVKSLDLTGSDNVPAVILFDHMNKMDLTVTENFRLFSQKVLKQAMELKTRDRLEFLYPEDKDDFESIVNEPGPSTFEEIVTKLESTGFYNNTFIYFRMDPKET